MSNVEVSELRLPHCKHLQLWSVEQVIVVWGGNGGGLWMKVWEEKRITEDGRKTCHKCSSANNVLLVRAVPDKSYPVGRKCWSWKTMAKTPTTQKVAALQYHKHAGHLWPLPTLIITMQTLGTMQTSHVFPMLFCLGVWGELQWKGVFQPKKAHNETIGLLLSGDVGSGEHWSKNKPMQHNAIRWVHYVHISELRLPHCKHLQLCNVEQMSVVWGGGGEWRFGRKRDHRGWMKDIP